jgi:hypothetical protein
MRSTRIEEVRNPGDADEYRLPVGHDSGYLWRLNTYWRYQAGEGGLYVECETLGLSRSIPVGLGWLLGPMVSGLPRDMLTLMLGALRKAL